MNLVNDMNYKNGIFEYLFNNTADSIFLNKYSKEYGVGAFIEVNDTMAKRLNVVKGDFKDHTFNDVLPDYNVFINGINVELQDLNHCLMEDNEVKFECNYLNHDNSYRYLEVKAKVLELGKQEAVLSIARDITSRVKYDEKLKLQKNFFGQLFDKSPNAIAMINKDDKIININHSFSELFEYSKDEAENKFINDLIVYGDIREEGELYSKMTLSGSCVQTESIRKSKSGREIPVSILAFPVVSEDEKIALYAIYSDISKRKRAEDKLKIMAEIFENNTEASMIIGKDRNIIWTNKAFESVTKFSLNEVKGKNPNEVRMYSDDLMNEIMDIVDLNRKWQGELIGIKADGETYSQWFNMFTVFDENGVVKNYVSIFSDLSDIKMHEEKIKLLSYTDKLTGLHNKTFLKETLKNKLFTAQNHEKIALLFIDLDDFKSINENISHTVGDEVLKLVAKEFSSCLRDHDLIARYGGDEFIILLNDFNSVEDAVLVGERIIQKLYKPMNINDMDIYLNASVGLSIYPTDGIDADSLIRNSEIAMYKAKEAGCSSLEVYSDELKEIVKEKYYMKNALRNALEKEEIYLMYQPIVDAKSNRIVGSEALARWNNAELGNIPPVKFIPLAEKGDEILLIGEWILNEACRQNKEWQEEGCPELFISVNISAKQLEANNFIDILKTALKENDLAPEYLELEITESVPMKNAEKCMALLEQIKALGVRISMDDFGTGYSSLSQMNQLSLSKLKIDKYFVDDIDKNGVLISTIIAMANSLNLTVVAEGVETKEQLSFLQESKCDMIQGYYFSKPLEPKMFLDRLSDIEVEGSNYG